MIRIFIGCSANGEDVEAQGMLEYSLKHYATEDLDLNWMKLSRDPVSPWFSNPKQGVGWNTTGWATPFSAFRWAIPYVCNFEGLAIYMDVDQIACADIKNLRDQTIPEGKAILAKNSQTHCCMLIDCAAVKRLVKNLPTWDQLRQHAGLYRSVRAMAGAVTAPFAGNWNCLDGENYKTLSDPDIKVIHFTRVETQPHLRWALPRLHAERRKHWGEYARPIGLSHARPDVAPMVENLWKRAQEAGFGVDRYLPQLDDMFGLYNAVRSGPKAA
jgi:hypothetical protein